MRKLKSHGLNNFLIPTPAKFCIFSITDYFLWMALSIDIVIKNGLTLFPPTLGGGIWYPPLWNQGRSCFRPHVAKSYFETYKSCDHMQNFRPLSQKFSEISRFEKFEFMRYCLTLTCENKGLIHWRSTHAAGHIPCMLPTPLCGIFEIGA